MYQKMKSEADDVADQAEQYVHLQAERFKLELIEKISLSLAEFIQLFLIGFFVFGGILLLCVAIGLVVQEFVENWIISAASATFFFAVIAYVTLRFGKKFIRDAITKVIIESTYGEE